MLLGNGTFDLIVTDHTASLFDGHSALETVRKVCPEVPFILFSDSTDEEMTIVAMKQGAADFVPKRQLERLAPAVYRAMREASEQDARRQTERALRLSEERCELLAEGPRRGSPSTLVRRSSRRTSVPPSCSVAGLRRSSGCGAPT